ncbi:MAG TPA: hypothetical protein VHB27_11950 [Rhodopila sp.]|uniref:hypothetical protein n=1 Tax=Rhodopila sp. TaxID=2480087 RepID=UPI002CAF452C|nr:hypothetical protein [Rhodopila sp.]HVY15933.1 hypothetical protein [Rhodopila sp.]
MATGFAEPHDLPASDEGFPSTDVAPPDLHAPMRGILIAMALSIPIWMVIGLVVYLMI